MIFIRNIKFMLTVLLFIALVITIAVQQVIIHKHNTVVEEKDKKIADLQTIIDDEEKEISLFKSAVAQRKDPIEIKVQQCIQQRGNVEGAASQCTLSYKYEWDEEIKETSKQLKQVLTPKQYDLFIKSQDKWEEYKSAQVQLLFNTIWERKGATHTNATHTYAVGITAQRSRDLLNLLHEMRR